ncbi:MAG: FtsK/SpoIIIE domain-containing protein [Dermatophilaceae bacterium]
MDLLLTVAGDATGSLGPADQPVPLLVTVPTDCTLGVALPTIAQAAGLLPGPVRVEGVLLDPLTPLGHPPLVNGARLDIGSDDAPGEGGSRHTVCVRAHRPGGHTAEVEVEVAAGPAAGARWRLPPGRYELGRGSECDLVVSDRSLSRRHAVLDVGARGAQITDAGSSNGTFADGETVGGRPHAIPLGAEVRVGATLLRIRRARAGEPRRGRPEGDGTLSVNRAPRVETAAPPVIIRWPTLREPPHPARPSLLTLLLPLAVSAGAALLLRHPLYLVFGLLGPLMTTTQFTSDARRHGRRCRQAREQHAHDVRQAGARRAAALSAEARRREVAAPDLARAVATCAGPTAELWRRDPRDSDWLTLRLGRGPVRSDVTIVNDDEADEHPVLPDAPLLLPMAKAGVAGIATAGVRAGRVGAGEVEAVASLARAALAQAVTWHGPRELRVWILADRTEALLRWSWLAHTPHVLVEGGDDGASLARLGSLDGRGDAAARLRELVALLRHRERRARESGTEVPREWHLVVLDGARRLREQPGTASILRDGPGLGVVSLCLDSRAEDLPSECAAVVTVSSSHYADYHVHTYESVRFAPDLCDERCCAAIGTSLAPLRDGTPEAHDGLPDRLTLADALGQDPTDPDVVRSLWAGGGATTSVPIGADAGGPVRVDLRLDGPHALVGGTTGSGKSELLRTLVASLAVFNRPDRLCFVLVDYKGGSAFDACADLPHVVGLVTDLDGSASTRALAGLAAELRRRESLLRQAGASDIESYAVAVNSGAVGADGTPLQHLPRLVLVVDEFRALADDLPEFVAGMVRIAALGRSLGIHLVLATQRPAGIVSADIRANVGLRIALRVRDESDALDVVDSTDAARLPARRPGRALLRTGGGPLVAFQTAYLASRARAAAPDVLCRALPLTALGGAADDLPLLARATLPGGPTLRSSASPERGELAPLVAAVRACAASLQIAPPPPPWLPPLPELLRQGELDRLDGADRSSLEKCTSDDPRRSCHSSLRAVALIDDPDHQRRTPWRWHPRDGHLAIVGRGRSGRTHALRALVLAVAEAECPAGTSIHIVDAGAGLRDLAELPHVASYLTLDHPGTVRRLCRGLRDRARARSPHADDAPTDLVVVDGWEQVRGILEGLEHGAAIDELMEAVRGGPARGVALFASGERGLLTGGLAACFAEKLVLALADPADALLAGVDPSGLGRRPSGRAIVASTGREIQVVQVGGASGAPAARLEPAARLHARHERCGGPTWRVLPLPSRVSLSRVYDVIRSDLDQGTGRASGEGSSNRVAVGLRDGGEALLLPISGRGWLVAGSRGSGRSSALAAIAQGLRRMSCSVLWCSPRQPELPGVDIGAWCGPGDGPRLATLLTECHVCLVDDLDALAGSPAESALTAHVAAAPPRAPVIAAGTLHDLVDSYRGLAGALRRTGQGLILGSSARGDELFGVRVPRGEPSLPGRGAWVRDGEATVVQLAVP